jgi:hypothetical protein
VHQLPTSSPTRTTVIPEGTGVARWDVEVRNWCDSVVRDGDCRVGERTESIIWGGGRCGRKPKLNLEVLGLLLEMVEKERIKWLLGGRRVFLRKRL